VVAAVDSASMVTMDQAVAVALVACLRAQPCNPQVLLQRQLAVVVVVLWLVEVMGAMAATLPYLD
jgi:hypothetical protein